MPFKKSKSGYFNQFGITRLNIPMKGIFLLKNEHEQVITIRASSDVTKEIRTLFNSNDYVWRYKPVKFEIEEVYFTDMNNRLNQLQMEIYTLMQEDIDLVSAC